MGEYLRPTFKEVPYQQKIFEPRAVDGYDTEDVVKDPSALETITSILKHKERVSKRLLFLVDELRKRALHHDDSKLVPPELDWLIEMDKEPRYPYGSVEYFAKMERWKKFFDHHYKNNRHHPDHFAIGIDGMTIADLAEYMVDIISYYDELHPKDAIKTIKGQKERFGLSDQLCQILINTLLEYYSWMGSFPPIAEEEAKIKESETTSPTP